MESPAQPDLLTVDDDPLISDTLPFGLERGLKVYAADSGAQLQSPLTPLKAAPRFAPAGLGLPPTPHRPKEGFKLIGTARHMKIHPLSGPGDPVAASGIVGKSFSVEPRFVQAPRGANPPSPALNEGRSGNGRGRGGDALHLAPPRAVRPYRGRNCAAILANLVAPTLLGHAGGTDAAATGGDPGGRI